MSICDGRQEAEAPTRLPRRPRDDILLPPPASARTPEMQATYLEKARTSPPGLSDTIKNEHLAYAVRHATEPWPRQPSTLAFGDRYRRFVSERVSDEQLLKRISEGSKAAMHIFFARHRMAVIGSIQRVVHNPAIAHDLVGYVFLDVWRNARRFGDRSRVSIWLFQVACFKSTSARRPRPCEHIGRYGALRTAPDAAHDAEEPNNVLRACVDGLSPAHREVIEMVYFREKSIEKQSELLGIHYAIMRGRLFYARKQFARMLAGACVIFASN